MAGSFEIFLPRVKGSGPGCITSGGFPPPRHGQIPTLVIVNAIATCMDEEREHLGIVFYGVEPQAWSCLSDAEVATFEDWWKKIFPGAQIVTVTEPKPAINCPPPKEPAALTAERAALAELAPAWFGAAAQPDDATPPALD